MKIYLAIPYTGQEEMSFEVANMIAGDLMNNQGHIVFSPISHTHPIAKQNKLPGHWEFWKKFDESFIEWCDQLWVVKLGDYKKSTGVNAEIEIAGKMQKPVQFIQPH